MKIFRSISNYRHWDLASTLGFPLLLWQNDLWPGSPLAGSRQGFDYLLHSSGSWSVASQPHRDTCPWRNAIYLHVGFRAALMVLRSSWVEWRSASSEQQLGVECIQTGWPHSLKQESAVSPTTFWVSVAELGILGFPTPCRAYRQSLLGGRAWIATGDAAPVCPALLCPYGEPSGGGCSLCLRASLEHAAAGLRLAIRGTGIRNYTRYSAVVTNYMS